MRTCRFVQAVIPNVEHHASPSWPAPQELDEYVASQSPAIECPYESKPRDVLPLCDGRRGPDHLAQQTRGKQFDLTPAGA